MKKTVKYKISAIIIFTLMLLLISGAMFSSQVYNNYKKMRLSETNNEIIFLSEYVSLAMEQLAKTAIANAIFGEKYLTQTQRNPDELDDAVKKCLRLDKLAVGMGVWFEPSVINPTKEKAGFYYYFDEFTNELSFDTLTIVKNEEDRYKYEETFWYTTIKEQILANPDKVVWTAPYFDDSGSFGLMISAGFGMFDNEGNFVGLSTIDWLLSEITDKISNIKPTPNTITLLADDVFNYIIAVSDPSKSMIKHSGSSTDTLEWFKYVDEDKTFIYRNNTYIPFVKRSNCKILLAAIVPQEELFAEINNYLIIMLLSFLVTAIIFVIIIYNLLDKLITKPISYLSKETEKIENGDFDIKIKTKSKDEFEQLANSFNSMAKGIKEYIEKLKIVTEEKTKISTELSIANQIHNSMLPNTFPAFPERSEFDIFAMIQPSQKVGGSFYDFFFINENHFAIIIANVSGVGIPTAVFSVIARTLLKNNICSEENLVEAFTKTNEQLCENNDTKMYMTAFAAVINIEDGKCSFINAGHNPAFIKRNNAEYEILDAQKNHILADIKNTVYREGKTELAFGDSLFLYTCGTTETNDLQKMLNSCSKTSMHNFILYIDKKRKDDLAMLSFAYTRSPGFSKKKEVFHSGIENINKVSRFVEDGLSKISTPEIIKEKILIAVKEIFVNISHYAYPESEKEKNLVEIHLLLNAEQKEIRAVFIDHGKKYNLLDEINDESESVNVGGLGIFAGKKFAEMQYWFSNGKNILALTKKW